MKIIKLIALKGALWLNNIALFITTGLDLVVSFIPWFNGKSTIIKNWVIKVRDLLISAKARLIDPVALQEDDSKKESNGQATTSKTKD